MPTALTSKPDDGRRDTLPQPPPRAGACPGPRHHEADNSRATKTGQLDELATPARRAEQAGPRHRRHYLRANSLPLQAVGTTSWPLRFREPGAAAAGESHSLRNPGFETRSEEHTSELQSLM